jgi:hypothetical protein
VFETNSGAREKMRLRHDEKPTLAQICAERRLISPGDFARVVPNCIQIQPPVENEVNAFISVIFLARIFQSLTSSSTRSSD